MTFGGEECNGLVHAPTLGSHMPLTAGTDICQGHQVQWEAVRVRHAKGWGTDQGWGGWEPRWRRDVACNCHIETNKGAHHSSFILDAPDTTQYVVVPCWSLLNYPERYSCWLYGKEENYKNKEMAFLFPVFGFSLEEESNKMTFYLFTCLTLKKETIGRWLISLSVH